MKRYLLLLLAALVACSVLAYDSVTVYPMRALTDGGKYYIYDSHGDDGTTNENDPSSSCRYALRYDSGDGIRGKHSKPVSEYRNKSLGNEYVWIAKKDGNNWKFQNVATQKWIGTGSNTVDEGTALTLEPTSKRGVFTVVVPGTNSRWDGNETSNFSFTYWSGNGHPIQFFEAETTNNGSSYTIRGRKGWHVYFTFPDGTKRQELISEDDDARDYLPEIDFATVTIDHQGSTIVSGTNKNFNVKITENLPFRTAANLTAATWQAWFMHTTYSSKSNRFTLAYSPNDDAANVTARRTSSSDAHPDEELWAFVGNLSSGFKIYNKKVGTDMLLVKGSDKVTLAAAPSDDATTLWIPVASKSNPDQGKYFTFRSKSDPSVYANLQWKEGQSTDNPVGLLKFWNAPDGGSTGWVEGVSQPIVDSYEALTTPRPTLKGVVGDFIDETTAEKATATAHQINSLVKNINPWAVIPATDQQKINELKKQLAAYKRIQFTPDKNYRLYNCEYPGYLALNEDGQLVGQNDGSDDTSNVSFTSAPTSGKYYLSIDGSYFTSVSQSARVGTTSYSDEAAEFSLLTVEQPFQFALSSDGESTYSYLHEDAQHNVVGWSVDERPSLWYLMPAPATGGLNELTGNASAAPVVYDLQGRRVAAVPASGLYIINGRKVLLK